MRRYFLIFVLFLIISSCVQREGDKAILFVSILPQKYFVERIAGNDFEVEVMIPPGHSPATYEPIPTQLLKLKRAGAYFTVSVPFEKIWIDRIKLNNENLLFVDTQKGIEFREIESYNLIKGEPENIEPAGGHDHEFDPHTWLSPSLVKVQAENIYEGLLKINPRKREIYGKNLNIFRNELDSLKQEIEEILKPVKKREILIFHPALGYFTDEFDFVQISIEIEGKEPGPAQLASIVKMAEERGIKVIFVQKQFSTKSAEAIAGQLGIKIITIDPLAENYPDNLISIAESIRENSSL